MRISDWSSDVCSSDLDLEAVALHAHAHVGGAVALLRGDREAQRRLGLDVDLRVADVVADRDRADAVHPYLEVAGLAGEVGQVERDRALVAGREDPRSDERRVGTECVSTCRSRGYPEH